MITKKKYNLGPMFRDRLNALVSAFAGSQAEFARSISLDRSALSQLMSDKSDRLPRAETLYSLAEQYDISLDWLLGLKPATSR